MIRWLWGALALALVLPAEAGILSYTVAHKATRLQEELAAALAPVPPSEIRVESDGQTRLRVTVPDSVPAAAVNDVVAAHNPAALSANEALEAARQAALVALAQREASARSAVAADRLPDPSQVPALIDTLFPTLTAPQRAYFVQLTRLLIAVIRERNLE